MTQRHLQDVVFSSAKTMLVAAVLQDEVVEKDSYEAGSETICKSGGIQKFMKLKNQTNDKSGLFRSSGKTGSEVEVSEFTKTSIKTVPSENCAVFCVPYLEPKLKSELLESGQG